MEWKTLLEAFHPTQAQRSKLSQCLAATDSTLFSYRLPIRLLEIFLQNLRIRPLNPQRKGGTKSNFLQIRGANRQILRKSCPYNPLFGAKKSLFLPLIGKSANSIRCYSRPLRDTGALFVPPTQAESSRYDQSNNPKRKHK